MDGTQSKPKFFERLISRLAGEPNSAEDVLTLLRQAHEQEVFDADTLTRLEKVLDFAELEVRDAMITRSRMNVLKENDSIERITAYIIETAHSRFPVIGEDKDEVLGILHAKDLLKYMFNPEQFHLKSVLRPAVFVPEGKSLASLLKEFREQRNHMAIVIDEYGGTSGLVTFEDIIEQIVGDIEDEFDEDESADNRRHQRLFRYGLQQRRSRHHRRPGHSRIGAPARTRRKSHHRQPAIYRRTRRQPPSAHPDGHTN